jgi:hypothetical protein
MLSVLPHWNTHWLGQSQLPWRKIDSSLLLFIQGRIVLAPPPPPHLPLPRLPLSLSLSLSLPLSLPL